MAERILAEENRYKAQRNGKEGESKLPVVPCEHMPLFLGAKIQIPHPGLQRRAVWSYELQNEPRSRNRQIINPRKKWGFRRFQKERLKVCKTPKRLDFRAFRGHKNTVSGGLHDTNFSADGKMSSDSAGLGRI